MADIESLHATQPAVGFWEVQCKVYRFQNMSSYELEKYAEKNPVPGVIAPDGNVYITGTFSRRSLAFHPLSFRRQLRQSRVATHERDACTHVPHHLADHHHFGRALLDATGISLTSVPVSVQRNLANVGTMSAFWRQMVQLQLVWLYDNHFRAPMNPFLLPASLKQCANDPYRDLAFLVRSNGGYGKTDTPYQDFMWGALFRQHGLIPDLFPPLPPPAQGVVTSWDFCTTAPFNPLCYGNLTAVIMQALPQALQIASSPAAATLPGYGQGVMNPPECGNGTFV